VEVLYGLGSPMPVEAAIETAAAFPRGSATGVPDAGHFPWLEQPGCVADALVRLATLL
jgi:pimeloyl-ACP methyl ester carboxylesterase